MTTLLIVVIVLVVLIFGAASIAQSIATAQQAQATIEVAKANQMATFANTAVIIIMLIVLLGALLLTVYLVMSRNRAGWRRGAQYVGVDMARGRDVSRKMIVSAPALPSTPSSPAGHTPGQYPDDFHFVGVDELTEFEKELLAFLEDRQ